MLAGFLRQFDVLPKAGEIKPDELPGLARGERFCSAYEQFHLCCNETEISFEHAVLLLNALASGIEIRLAGCSTCGDLVVEDCLSARRAICAYCPREAHAGIPDIEAQCSSDRKSEPEGEMRHYHQESLF